LQNTGSLSGTVSRSCRGRHCMPNRWDSFTLLPATTCFLIRITRRICGFCWTNGEITVFTKQMNSMKFKPFQILVSCYFWFELFFLSAWMFVIAAVIWLLTMPFDPGATPFTSSPVSGPTWSSLQTLYGKQRYTAKRRLTGKQPMSSSPTMLPGPISLCSTGSISISSGLLKKAFSFFPLSAGTCGCAAIS